MQSYVEKSHNELLAFSQKAKEIIKNQVWKHLNENYEFLILTPKSNIESFVTENFKVLNGKIYRNSKQENSLIFGLERNKKESEEVKKLFLDIVRIKIDIINSNNNS